MQEADKLWNWKYIIFVGLQTLNYALFYMSFPVIPKYSVSIGLDLGIAGILSGGFAIASLIARPIAGYSIDHFERKRIMMLSLGMCGISTMALPLTSNWILLFGLRMVYGCSFSFFSTILVSCAADYIPKRNMAEGISYFGLGVALAAAIAPPAGLRISESLGMKALFIMMGIASIVSAAVIFFVPVAAKEHLKENRSFAVSDLIEKSVIIFAVLVMPFAFSNGFINSFIALTAEERHIEGYDIYFTVFAVVMMILKPLAGKMQDRFGLSSVLIPAFLFTATACGIISVAQTLFLLIIAAVLQAFGQGAGQPALLATCVGTPKESRRGVAISTYYLGLDLGIGIGSISGSKVADVLGYKDAYLLCSALLLLGCVIYIGHLIYVKRRKKVEI